MLNQEKKVRRLLQQTLNAISTLPPAVKALYAVTAAALRLQLQEVQIVEVVDASLKYQARFPGDNGMSAGASRRKR